MNAKMNIYIRERSSHISLRKKESKKEEKEKERPFGHEERREKKILSHPILIQKFVSSCIPLN